MKNLSKSLLWLVILILSLTGCSGTADNPQQTAPITAQQPQTPATQIAQPVSETENTVEPVNLPSANNTAGAVETVAALLPSATITRVVDGDTLLVNLNGQEQRVRLILVDTPESVHPDQSRNSEYGKIASAYTASQLPVGKTVYLQKDVSETDRYSRLLRYVWLEQPANVDSETEVRAKMYNAKLLLEGYANLATFPPDVKYVDMFRTFQTEAREADKGLWAYQTEPEPAVAAPVQEKPAVTQNQNAAALVYITPSGTKYHRENCRTIRNTKTGITLKEAQAQGYEPCKVCNP